MQLFNQVEIISTDIISLRHFSQDGAIIAMTEVSVNI